VARNRSSRPAPKFQVVVDHWVNQYDALKDQLSRDFAAPEQRHGYVEAKAPFIWETIRGADDWAQHTGCEPPPSDC
jgi:hypothetical protein